jgi:cytochrome P450
VLRRKPNPHVSFGLRVRICIGRSLARLESLVALSRIARAFPGLQVTGRPVFTANARFRQEVTGSITGATAAAHRGHQAPELR